MLRHLRRLLLATSLVCLGMTSTARPAAAQSPGFEPLQGGNTLDFQTVSLKDQLKFGLRVTTPQQEAYIDQVVLLVDQGQLPRSLVNIVYRWAIERNPRVPLPYFQIALRTLAERRGITVP
jgi:hypothetical protein